MTGPKVAVLGAGANGASIGADLARAGVDVTLIEQWPDHVATMREYGVRIEMPAETVTTPVRVLHLCEVATLRERFDVVLIVMKAYDAHWSAQLIEPYLADDALVAGVQNGMTTDAIAQVVGAHRTVGAVIEISSIMYRPGLVERHSGPDRSWFAVGAVDDAVRGRESEVGDLLAHAGTVEIVDDIMSTKWMKLVSNATTLVTTAVLGLPMLDAVALPGMRELMIRSGQEALAAGRHRGHQLLPIFGLDAQDLAASGEVVEQLLDTLLEGFVLPTTETTILQDWKRGRHSEVDDINGLVVETHRAHGERAPVNAAVVELAHRIERGELAPDPANLDLLHELAEQDVEPSPRLR